MNEKKKPHHSNEVSRIEMQLRRREGSLEGSPDEFLFYDPREIIWARGLGHKVGVCRPPEFKEPAFLLC